MLLFLAFRAARQLWSSLKQPENNYIVVHGAVMGQNYNMK